MLSQLIYTSRATSTMNYSQLRDINETAMHFNASQGLTGMLLYGSSCFLQVIEGDRDAISRTYHRISRDQRHHEPSLIDVSEITSRAFQQWSMRFVMLDSVNGEQVAATLLRFGVSRHFQPFGLSASSARELLQALASGITD